MIEVPHPNPVRSSIKLADEESAVAVRELLTSQARLTKNVLELAHQSALLLKALNLCGLVSDANVPTISEFLGISEMLGRQAVEKTGSGGVSDPQHSCGVQDRVSESSSRSDVAGV